MLKSLSNISRKKKIIILIIIDIILSFLAYHAAIYLRLEKIFLLEFSQYFPFLLSLLIYLGLLFITKVYRNINRVSNISYLSKIFIIFNIYAIIFFISLIIIEFDNFPRSVGIIQPLIFLLFVFFVRIIYIFLINEYRNAENKKSTLFIFSNLDRLINSFSEFNVNNNVCAYIDLSNKNIKRQINNIRIYSFNDYKKLIDKFKINNIVVQTDDLTETDIKKFLQELFKLNIRIQLIDSKNIKDSSFSEKDFNINLFLKRNINVNDEYVREDFKNITVLVTGAGGSIGQELCKQILLFKPSRIILFDHSEYNLYQTDKKLGNLKIKNNFKTEVIPVLGCIKNKNKINKIFSQFKPEKVFHAAAYKHVNMVEKNYLEALENNFFGTLNLLDASIKFSVKKFTLISTDKSVNPSNHMGVSKRLSEMAIESLSSSNIKTIFSAVRFGNVIDSSGSVIPLFREQIKNGGPVTVTDPNVKRYFMLISEAVSLVINADLMSKGGEIFTLNMGQQHKILDLANLMIKSSGLLPKDKKNPDGDIEIRFIGLKPGEKMEEELNYMSSKLLPTKNKNIFKTITKTVSKEEFDKIVSDIKLNKNDKEKLYSLYKDSIEGFSVNYF